MGIRIWLDDNHTGYRPAPLGWIHVHNSQEFWMLLESNTEVIDEMSFDNDLGEVIEGYDIVKTMAGRCLLEQTLKYWPRKIYVHSANTVTNPAIRGFVESFNKLFPDESALAKWK
ncbi:MAG: hypothetical protein HY226_05415 [Candidatus Vogelbacteria bacterium]|nr:hypothetical protein [Candidatus Vogelbacteria bacterium]